MEPDGAAGREKPQGEVGEICFSGPQVFLGYLGDAEATKRAISRVSSSGSIAATVRAPRAGRVWVSRSSSTSSPPRGVGSRHRVARGGGCASFAASPPRSGLVDQLWISAVVLSDALRTTFGIGWNSSLGPNAWPFVTAQKRNFFRSGAFADCRGTIT